MCEQCVRPIEKCGRCGHEGLQLIGPGHKCGHHASVRCAECNSFMRWLTKPDGDKVKRPAKHRNLVTKYSKGFCEMCLRNEGDLPTGQVLEAQHVQEYANGGSEDRENIWIVCTGCHKFIHWIRTYHGAEHLQPIVESTATTLTA
jgi:5-methylcytosine-specific restriction endonuclease McrA